MLPGRRPFKEVSLNVTGAQSVKDRFPNRKRDHREDTRTSNVPCNVTGLSHVYNLYFVAYLGNIFVYEPQFPSQNIEQEPVLVIETDKRPFSPKDHEIYGVYANQGTRTINRLLVQRLGTEEVVAVVRNDGDVEAYYTRHIHQAIEKRAHDKNTLGVSATDVRPFFHRTVGDSAWGLAIHSTARMIAVSANTHWTTVFTFALTDGEPDDQEDPPDGDDVHYFAMRGTPPPNDRRKNDVRILAHSGGKQNLPDIAFCNTSNDPAGRWLLTADILGTVAAWDVHNLQLMQLVNTAMNPPLFPIPSGYMDTRNGVWGLMFLDPLSFRAADTVKEAFGISPRQVGFDLRKEKDSAIWDLSRTMEQIDHVRRPFKDVGKPVKVRNGNYADPLETSRQAPNGSPIPVNGSSRRVHVEREDNSSEEDSEGDDEDDLEDEDDSDVDYAYDSAEETHVAVQRRDGTIYQVEKPRPGARFRRGEGLCGDLPCPIMQLSFQDVYLYQPSLNNKAWDHFPMPSIRRLFRQEVPAIFESPKFGRISMYTQIPSLGVVIIATQKGRVAILSLTSTTTKVLDYARFDPSQLPTERPRIEKRVYGFRVDHMLPLPSQEEAGHRPKAGIHGIAVGPVQGTEHLEDGLKRWRLMVHYQNFAMLAYEIGKPRKDTLDLSLTAL
ncbi:hypothetical protein AUEXF2481DRAFT_36532 [Aureobasidium subglaciale EXF-2481]|uniref:Uncharacterized protein n=1 Tax=Aureobasidium subglaciale (strain EXF-2481) TaxID=1043005 RepID=A0A074YNF0_AURSE|nr:uncharacterized protein AUEXF2481DRAFT_36532 [Aureobasidium subglaciale EXF-2481]KAI5207560.1 hypothetical protein E4T38_03277 [Aureobasidium subglaciale]KAI5226495.1 hypothetical protein E4T40_03051 [Aureobasidium subglaciale]KAI5229929.1 hypothetical protein E4T41_03274 [Aureobasidium subglaciale]KAI5264484.1 hypothetical protein E4T46_03052 [Aureobasidium subglaciale]KEQ99215.1 hypothetical protein AUEXF2481DRAFT_36532 [Aureobasidium subglaciale EXF-2481]